MSVFEFECPVCGKMLETESNVKTMYCPYCEEKVNVLKAVEDQKIELENEKISYFTKIENYKTAGDEALEKGEYQEAVANYYECLKLDKSNDYVIKLIVKASNLAIEKHYKTFQNMYIETHQHINKTGLNDEVNEFIGYRESALSMLDPREITPEMRETPTEHKIMFEVRKRKKTYFILRAISIVLAITLVILVIVFSFK